MNARVFIKDRAVQQAINVKNVNLLKHTSTPLHTNLLCVGKGQKNDR